MPYLPTTEKPKNRIAPKARTAKAAVSQDNTTGPAIGAPAYAPVQGKVSADPPMLTDRYKTAAAATEFGGAAATHPAEASIKAETAAIQAETARAADRTDAIKAGRVESQERQSTLEKVQDNETLDGFSYSPEQRAQLGKAGAGFKFGLPDDLAVKRKRITDPGFMPGSPPAENTPEEYQATVDKLNAKYYPELADVPAEERRYGFKYDPDTQGVVGVGSPAQQARAEQEKADRLERGRADLAEARSKGISIGELREQRREVAKAQHEAEVAKAGAPEKPGDPAGTAAPAFSDRVQRTAENYTKAIQDGGDVKTAARSVHRTHRDERIGPWAAKPSTQDRAMFTNHVGNLMAAKGVGSAKAKVLNEALDDISMADVRYLLKNPSLANANELEQLLFMDLFANADGVAEDDIKGLGTLIMESYGVDYKGRRQAPKADEDE